MFPEYWFTEDTCYPMTVKVRRLANINLQQDLAYLLNDIGCAFLRSSQAGNYAVDFKLHNTETKAWALKLPIQEGNPEAPAF